MPAPASRTKPNTAEDAQVTNSGGILRTWGQLIDEMEFVPELRWPASVWVYNRMVASDSHVSGLMSGTVNPLVRFRWSVDPQDSKPEVYEALSKELKIPVKGKEEEFKLGRTRGRFMWRRHLPEALKFLTFGHYPFLLVMDMDEQKYGDDLYHIKRMMPLPPSTLSQINVERNGDLAGIKQFSSPFGAAMKLGPGIEASSLLWYVWDKEGANWAGRSLLRSCFRNYVMKDMLMRIDAQKHDRMGMGIPWFEAPEGASQELIDSLDELAQEVRAGDESGLAVPAGAKLKLAGVEGSVPDTVESIRMHNEEMSKAFLMMFMQLGATKTGSRALGSELINYFSFAQEAIADVICDIFTEGFVEPWVDWNWGEGEAAPRIVYNRSEHEDETTEDLTKMVAAGLIKMDPELESFFRQSRGLPVKSQETREAEEQKEKDQQDREDKLAETQPPPPEPSKEPEPAKAGSGRRSREVKAEAEGAPSPLSLPDRVLRRQPYEHEVAAATDFARMDEQWNAKRDALFEAVKELQAAQVDELHALIVEADGDLVKLSQLAVDDNTHEAILASMQEMADEGIDQAASEAEAQGVSKVKRPKLSDLESSLTARAQGVGQVLTRELSAAAGKKAMDLSGGALKPEQVADAVKEHLMGLTKARVKDQISGATSTAQNAGRKLTMRRNDPQHIYSSELLDENTCKNCTAEDGTEFGDVDAAEADYPGGGYADCEGGERCRGTLVAVYNEEEPSNA